ncbi:unnamed protein product, partial [Adineta steineri]
AQQIYYQMKHHLTILSPLTFIISVEVENQDPTQITETNRQQLLEILQNLGRNTPTTTTTTGAP